MKKVLVAMSGGVDSSLAAALLKKQGYSVTGLTMKLTESTKGCAVVSSEKSCCGYDAVRNAKKVAAFLDISHYAVNAVEYFEKNVIDHFERHYAMGLTPNPCIRCNHLVKFEFLMKKADELGCDFLATGHYARIKNGVLKRGLDKKKDQSYFLYPVFACDSERILFPLGEMSKDEVRVAALKLMLPNASAKESQDICFIPDGNYVRFLEKRGSLQNRQGKIVDIKGNLIGTHAGIHYFTVGQRKGLGALGRKMYVREIRVEDNCVVAATEEQINSDGVMVKELLRSGHQIRIGDTFDVQIRYRSAPMRAAVDHLEGDRLGLAFFSPVRAVAPGQAAVLYDGECVIAGGVIESSANGSCESNSN